MTRKIEVFSKGCPTCDEAVEMVNRIACPSCEVTVHDMGDEVVARRASELGIKDAPGVVIDGELAACCGTGAPDEGTLRAAGLGQAVG